MHDLEDYLEYKDELVTRINTAKKEIRAVIGSEETQKKEGEECHRRANEAIQERYETLVKILSQARD